MFNTRPIDFYDAYILATTQKFDKDAFAEAPTGNVSEKEKALIGKGADSFAGAFLRFQLSDIFPQKFQGRKVADDAGIGPLRIAVPDFVIHQIGADNGRQAG